MTEPYEERVLTVITRALSTEAPELDGAILDWNPTRWFTFDGAFDGAFELILSDPETGVLYTLTMAPL